MKARRLTFYLLRQDVAEFEDALDTEKASVAVDLDPSAGVDGRFVYPGDFMAAGLRAVW